MKVDCGVYKLDELNGLDAHGEMLRDTVGELTRIRPWWFARTRGADPAVVSAVRAGGVAGCVTAIAFYQRHVNENIWVPPDNRIHVRRGKRGKPAVLLSKEIVYCQGHGRVLPTVSAVDSIPQALSCAARCLSDEYWIAVCDSVLHYTEWTIPDLQAHMGQVSEHVRDLMSRCDDRAESGSESLVRVRLRSAGFKVDIQPVIGRRNQRADLCINRLLIECDSKHHDGAARARDIRRDRKTLAKGWLTIRIDYQEVLECWDEVFADILDLLGRKVWRIRVRHSPRPALID